MLFILMPACIKVLQGCCLYATRILANLPRQCAMFYTLWLGVIVLMQNTHVYTLFN